MMKGSLLLLLILLHSLLIHSQQQQQSLVNEYDPVDEINGGQTKFATQAVDYHEKELGSEIIIYCDVTGNPKPKISWYHNENLIPGSMDNLIITDELWGEQLEIKSLREQDVGNYTCVGSNNMRSQTIVAVKKRAPSVNRNIPQPMVALNKSKKNHCQKFGSSVCSKNLKGHYYYLGEGKDMSAHEYNVFQVINIITNQIKDESVIESKCFNFLTNLLCHYNFPVCLENEFSGNLYAEQTENGARRKLYSHFEICRSDCIRFTQECSNFYHRIKASIPSSYNENWIDCSELKLTSDAQNSCVRIESDDNSTVIMPDMNEYIDTMKDTLSRRQQTPSTNNNYWPIVITFSMLFAFSGILILTCLFCRCAFMRSFNRNARFTNDPGSYNIPRTNFLRQNEFKANLFNNVKFLKQSSQFVPIIHNAMPTAYTVNNNSKQINTSISNENPGSFDSTFNDSFTKNQHLFPNVSTPSQKVVDPINKSPINTNFYNNTTNSTISRHHYQTVLGSQPQNTPSSNAASSEFDQNGKNYKVHNWNNYAKFNQFTMSPYNLQKNTLSSEENTPTSIELNSDIIDYNYNSLKFDCNLGQGLFGPMYNGELHLANNTYENGNDTLNYGEMNRLFIKTLAPGSSGSLQVEFINEANVMNQLKHVNLLSLMGVSIHQLPWCMLFDISGYYELHDYFININLGQFAKADQFLLQIAQQTSSGLVYLSNKNFAHQDISARNILINPHVGHNSECAFTIKLTNLAFGRTRYSSDYQAFMSKSLDANNNSNTQIYLPIRWMAPESLVSGKFTLESDIWSFGIFIWELLTDCKLKPYYNINEAVIIDHIVNVGNKITLPKLSYSPQTDTCIKPLMGLMYDCLNHSPNGRPKFPTINDSLKKLLYKGEKTKKSLTESINSSLTQTTISSNSTVSSTSKNYRNVRQFEA